MSTESAATEPPPVRVPAIILTVVGGPAAGKVFRFTEHGMFTVGRVAGLHVCVPNDPYLSRAHCLVEFNPPKARVIDLDSKSGTWLNGTRIAESDLADGDRVRAGGTTFKVILVGPEPVPAPPRLKWGGAAPAPQPNYGTLDQHAFPDLPGYAIEAELGRGNMGVVYRARKLGRPGLVALKVIHPAVTPTAAAVGRFRREADILRELDHPNIVAFVDAGATDDRLFCAMEYVPGVDAAAVLDREGPVPPDRLIGWAAQMLDALAHAHDVGFVHRDIKPGNLLVVPGGGPDGDDLLKVSDFGLARAYDASSMSGLTLSNTPGGTPLFMPPEQATDFRGVKPAADQYAAAATLYFLLTGCPVYGRETSLARQLQRLIAEPPDPLKPGATQLPPPFGPVICRALARDPRDRFPDVRAMRAALLRG